MAGFLDNTMSVNGTRPVGKWLKNISRLGMKYEDMVIRNSRALGIAESKMGNSQALGMHDSEDMWYAFAAMSLTDTSMRKNISFFDKEYPIKREELRELSKQDEIEEILDILSDETVVYDPKNYFCKPTFLGGEMMDDKLRDSLESNFKKIYMYFGFNDGQSAWEYFRKWLIDGYLSFEIIYDNNEKNIIGFKELDPITLVPGIEKGTNKKVWIQFKGEGSRERMLYDSHIIYISYSTVNSISRVSYTERLIRAFNLLRIMETTRIIWAVTNASFKMKFVIPVGGKSKTRAKQSLSQLMHNYRELIDFNYQTGELNINGKPMMAFNKEYWMPSKDGEEPQIESVGGDGPEISDTETVKYFSDKLKLVSKIPFNRFDKESPAGFEVAAEGMTRDEIRFSRFLNRLRAIFKEIIVKPLYIQMILDHTALVDDEAFKANVSVAYNKDNIFEELKQQELSKKRVEFIASMKELSEMDAEMNEIPYWDMDFLIQRYGGFDEEDIKTNKIYKYIKELKKEGYSDEDSKKIAYGAPKSEFKPVNPEADDSMDMGMGIGVTNAPAGGTDYGAGVNF